MRNRLIHEYTTIRMDIVWQAVEVNIPVLIEIILPLLGKEEEA
jgi:uncharacterized protein with HEPN domain